MIKSKLFMAFGLCFSSFTAEPQAVQPGATAYLHPRTDPPVQQLTIEDCYRIARQNYPLTRRRELIRQARDYSIENISKGSLPQVSFSGKATYQSDVTQIPAEIPGMDIETLSKDQYQLTGEVTQNLFDGGVIRQQKEMETAKAEVEQRKLEVELYQLKERINQIYFGILLIDAQLAQVQTLKADIRSGISKMQAAFENGAVLKSEVDILQAELLKAGQQETELKAGRKAYLHMLGLFLNQELNEQTVLREPGAVPEEKLLAQADQIQRPELRLYEQQEKNLEIQDKLITAKNLPRIGLFFQGGYGRPGLNMLNNQFDLYYLGGIQINWSLSGLYTAKKERQLLNTQQEELDVQRETFLFNTSQSLLQTNEEMAKLGELIKSDREIIRLREHVKKTANVQLKNGAITANDYLKEVHAEDTARQQLLLHEVQLLMSQYNHQLTTGNN